MFYVLGPMEAGLFENKAPEVEADAKAQMNSTGMKQVETQAEKDAVIAENAVVHFGRVEADPIELSKLHQDVRDLADKMTASEKRSEE
jgi:hypothetical protein